LILAVSKGKTRIRKDYVGIPLAGVAALAYVCRKIRCRHCVEWKPKAPHLVFKVDPLEFAECWKLRGSPKLIVEAARVLERWEHTAWYAAAATDVLLMPLYALLGEEEEEEEG